MHSPEIHPLIPGKWRNPRTSPCPMLCNYGLGHVKTAVHRTLNQQHAEKPETYPQKGLPKKCFGRMKQRKLCRVPITPPIPQACEGQYNPPTETSTYRVLQNTKQIRRLQSLRQRIIKTADPNHTQDLGDLQKEWIAIMGSKGFGNFPKWCLNKPELAYLPYGLPPTDFLDIAIDLLKHENRCTFQSTKSPQTAHSEIYHMV